MALFNWNDSYSVNVRDIDNQHKALVDILNELFEAMSAQKSNEVLGVVINKLINYTKQHFSSEEIYMTRYAYPDIIAHKKEHEEFTNKVLEFKKGFDSGKIALSIEVTSFLKTWLIKHISGTDKKYTAFFNSKGLK